MDIDIFPNSVEYWGPNGMVFFRNRQIRYMPVMGENHHVTISLEEPGASGDAGEYDEFLASRNGLSARFPVPDLAAFASTEPADRFSIRAGDPELDRLLSATARAFADAVDRPADVTLSATTTIPRAVGLAGSSALIICALRALGAERIGHGVRSIEDPALLLYLKERQIPLEINPYSNVRLGVYPSPAQHPFPHLDRMGLFVTLNSDDPPLFNTSLLDEYALLADTFGYDRANLARIARNGFVASCAEPALKQKLLAEFDAWQQS